MKRKTLFIVASVLVVIAFCYGYVAFGGMTYSEGDRIGTIVKFSRKGTFVKTWEGELHMGGITEGGVPSVWEFSVDDEEAIKQVDEAQSWGRVKLHYKEQMWAQSWRGATSYFVVGVERLTVSQ